MRWFAGSVSEAIAEAKSKNAVFIVYISGDDEQSAKMNTTFDSVDVSSILEGAGCIAVKLQSDSDMCRQFSQIYPVVIIPSTFFIGENGVPLEIIGGDLPPKEFLNKINNVIKVNSTAPEIKDSVTLSDNTADLSVSSAVDEQIENSLSSESQATSTSVIEERTERVKQLLAERREQRLKQQSEEEKMKEVERRKVGQDVQKLRQWQQNVESKQLADDIAKEKAEERAARERVREQIARDRAERAARFQAEKREVETRQQESQVAALQAQQAKLSAEALARSNFARLQFRFPDGSSDTHQFSADDTLEQVRQYILQASKSPLRAFTLSTTFPRREFQEFDYSQSLRDLQLAPCAAILVLPIQHTLVPTPPTSMYTIFWTAVSPFIALLNYIRVLIFGRQPGNAEPHSLIQKSPHANSPGEVPDSALSSNRPITAYKRRNPDESNSPLFSRKEGNIHRFSNRKDDDDENATWNGNSTQQM